MTLTFDAIRRMLGEAAFTRGWRYCDEGRVRETRSCADGTVAGAVQGSNAQSYRQRISLRFSNDARLRGINGTCDCPVGYNCKHVAAALIALARRETPATPSALPAVLTSWLAQVETAATSSAVDANDYPATVRDRLLYVVAFSGANQLAVTPMKASLSKAGVIGKQVRRFDASRLRWGDTPQFIRPVDLTILRRIALLGLNGSPYVLRSKLLDSDSVALLQMIAGTGRGRWGEPQGPVLQADSSRQGRLTWIAGDDGQQRLTLRDRSDAPLQMLPVDPATYIEPSTGGFGALDLKVGTELAWALLAAPAVPPAAAPDTAAALSRLANVPVPQIIGIVTRAGDAPVPILKLFAAAPRQRYQSWERREVAAVPTLRLAFDYAGHRVEAMPATDPTFRDGGQLITLCRDRSAEAAAHGRLDDSGARRINNLESTLAVTIAGLDHAFADDFDDLAAPGAASALRFMAETLPELRRDGWQIEIDPSWPYRLHEGPLAIRAGVESAGSDWFAIGLTVEVEGQRFDLAPLLLSVIAALPLDAGGELMAGFELDAWLAQLSLYPRLADGTHVALPTATLAPLIRAFLSVQGLLGGFHPAEAASLATLATALAGCEVPFEGGAALIALGHQLRALTENPLAEPPAALTATLRPYQQTGYGWLRALAETGFGGILADDMGLGKTVQTLALLAARHLEADSPHPSLLVAPTSLVGAWQREAARFVPALKVLVLHGPDRRRRFDQIAGAHLVITTYPLLHRDHELLLTRTWDIAILDEAQAAKNPASSLARHIRGIDARLRLALTGTPMENSLEDLWALFDWVIPGLLGDRKSFKARFRLPIERDGDTAVQRRLNARLRPFLLRRTKADVAADLPAKTEIIELVPLGDDQRALYESLRLTMDARVREAIAARGIAASRLTILTALLKLRQVCCDPALLPHGPAPPATSAKRTRLLEMLELLIAEGRRVLVFSQFVSMLRLIEADIIARGWDYAWLTGTTKDRETVVDGFQDGTAPIFLISLKAGGTGLTLTAADTVILYDPWWNPAVERQAMDRVHRIGQDRAVFVYRLVAEGAVEQAIVALQAKKQGLADALFDGPANGPLALTEADLAALFQPIAAG